MRRPASVLPWESAAEGRPWRLKLHGSIDHQDDIVLSRDDYLSYGERRAALAGIVQALLITRHMLFVGFGLDDDNFHRILHEVRNAVGDATSRPDSSTFGTVLALEGKPLATEMWRGDLRTISLGSEVSPESARRLELFLDLLVSDVADSASHLLDESFAAVRDPVETQLAEAVGALARVLSRDDIAEHPSAAAAVDLVRRFGGDVVVESHSVPMPAAAKGSKQRMREVIDRRQGEVDRRLKEGWPTLAAFKVGPLRWLSPVAEHGYRELRDESWVRADLPAPTPQGDGFWPRRGPVWDGVAVVPGVAQNGVLLVEAKSHEQELKSGESSAAGDSLRQINAALGEAKQHLRVPETVSWPAGYYQLANRLAYLYYLRVRRGIPAWLLFVYFTGDSFPSGGAWVSGPQDAAGWTAPIHDAEQALGLTAGHTLEQWTHKLFLDV